jgi:hypothetical protein
MNRIGQPFRLGIWMVKSENIPEFIEAWQLSVDWITQKVSDDGEGFLLQDTQDPNKFVSFAFSSNPDKSQEVRSQAEYQELFSRVQALCDSVQPHKMNVVGYSSSSKDE